MSDALRKANDEGQDYILDGDIPHKRQCLC
jgi:hypothetical protein